MAQLRSVLPLLDAQATQEVRSRLLVATADLAMQVAWMSYEINQHHAARRLWLIADPTTAPPWSAHIDGAEFAFQHGHVHYTLALAA